MKRPCSRPSEAFTFLCVLLFVQRSFLKCDRRICVNSSFPWRQSGFWTTFLRSARRSRSRSRGRSRGRGVPPPPRPQREELSRRPPQPPPPPPPRPGWQLSERHVRNHNIEIMISFAFFCIFLRVKIMMVLVNDILSLSTHNLLKSSKVSKFLEVFPSNVFLSFFPLQTMPCCCWAKASGRTSPWPRSARQTWRARPWAPSGAGTGATSAGEAEKLEPTANLL